MSKLWAIYIPGPCECHAAPSEAAAAHMAERHNASMADYYAKHLDTSGFRPPLESVKAQVVEWPHEPAEHAEEIASFDFEAWGLKGGAV